MGVHACMCVRVCVPHIKPFFLPVDISSTPSVRAVHSVGGKIYPGLPKNRNNDDDNNNNNNINNSNASTNSTCGRSRFYLGHYFSLPAQALPAQASRLISSVLLSPV